MNVKDPEIDCNIVDLGLVYGININDNNDVDLKITLTSLGCPLTETLIRDVNKTLGAIQGLGNQMADFFAGKHGQLSSVVVLNQLTSRQRRRPILAR